MQTELDFVLEKIEAGARHLRLYQGADHIDMPTAMLLLGMIIARAKSADDAESQLAEMTEFANRLLVADGVRLIPNGGR